MKKVLLTGGTGYLGSNIAKALIEQGYDVLIPSIKNAPLNYIDGLVDRLALIEIDDNYLNKVIDFEPDVIVHTACLYDRNGASMYDVLDANLIFPLKLLSVLAEIDKELLWINTSTALDPFLNLYSLSKFHFSQWGIFFSKNEKHHFCNVMLEHFFGPWDSKNKFISFLYDKLSRNESIELTAGTQKRDFIYVDDVVRAYLLLIEKTPNGNTEFDLGTGDLPSVREVVEYLANLMKSTSKLNFGAIPIRENEIDYTKNSRGSLTDIGFNCEYTWRSGLEKMVELQKMI